MKWASPMVCLTTIFCSFKFTICWIRNFRKGSWWLKQGKESESSSVPLQTMLLVNHVVVNNFRCEGQLQSKLQRVESRQAAVESFHLHSEWQQHQPAHIYEPQDCMIIQNYAHANVNTEKTKLNTVNTVESCNLPVSFRSRIAWSIGRDAKNTLNHV